MNQILIEIYKSLELSLASTAWGGGLSVWGAPGERGRVARERMGGGRKCGGRVLFNISVTEAFFFVELSPFSLISYFVLTINKSKDSLSIFLF